MSTSEELKKDAIKLGLCPEWTQEWGEPDKDELCDKYVRGIDFAILHNYPSLEYMKSNFDGVMQKHGIYVNDKLCLHNPKMVVANGECVGTIYFDRFSVGRMYIRHDSEVSIYVSGNAKVFISIYDSAKINIFCKDSAKVYVYQHGGRVNYDGDVLVRNNKAGG